MSDATRSGLGRNRPAVVALVVIALVVVATLVTVAATQVGGSVVAAERTRADLAATASRHTVPETVAFATSARADAPDPGRGNPRITVDVAEDHTRFFFDEAPVFEDGFPSAGNSFSTAGYLYPSGTLSEDKDGVNEDGSPAYPDKVLGEWLCRGYFIGEGAHATEGAWVFSTQLFAFGHTPTTGEDTVVVVGYEGAGVGEPVTGAITGGTGRFQGASGQAVQELLGFTLFDGNDVDMPIKKRMTLRLSRQAQRGR